MNLPRFIRRLRGLFRRKVVDAEMSEEMRHHLEMQERENLARGMSPLEARYSAQRTFGGVEQIKERVREQRSWAWIEDLRHDLRYTGRSFARNPAFTAVIVFTLAFAIGAGTAVFTTAQEFLLTSPPIREPETLVRLSRPGTQGYTYSYPFYEELRDEAASIAGVIATSSSTRTMAVGAFGQSIPEGVLAAEVSGNYFSLLGIQPVLGRAIGLEDDRATSPAPVVVLSHALWRDRFAADQAVLGKTIVLDGVEFTIAGVAPESFKGVEPGRPPQLWLPLSMMPRVDGTPVAARFKEARAGWLRLTARLAPQTSPSEARARFEAIFQRHLTDRGVDFASNSTKRGQGLDGRIELVPKGGFNQVGPGGKFAIILMSTAVGLVLMVACANVASLLLTRAMTRQREFALRSALGAGNARLVRQLLTESLSLSLLAGSFGVLLSNWGIQAFIHRFAPPGALDGIVFDFKLNPGVLLFAIGTACGVGVIVGLAPAWHFRRIDLISRLKQQESTTTALSRQRLQRFLVVAQIAVSICLLVGAGLMTRTLQNLRAIDLGFIREKVLQVQVILDKNTEPSLRTVRAREILDGASALPGVRSATLGENTFGLGRTYSRIDQVEGYVPGRNEDMSARPVYVGPAFFEQWGIPVLQGRGLTEAEVFPRDVHEAQVGGRVAVVSETFARKYFGSANPIGRTFQMDPRLGPLEVVGVARDVMFEGLPNKSPYVVYLPFVRTLLEGVRVTLQIRTIPEPTSLADDVRKMVNHIAPGARVQQVTTLEGVMEEQTGFQRAMAEISGLFGGFALALAGIGLYGVLAYTVARRNREIGIRMALGAAQRDVVFMIVRQGLRLATSGCVVGLVCAVPLMTLAPRLLYGVTATDPTTILGSTLLIVAAAFLACWLPARRATKVDPMIALRAE